MDDTGKSIFVEFAAPMAYILGPFTGLFFYIFSKNVFVRFHAMQSIVTFSVLVLLQIILTFIPVLSRLVPLLTILTFVLWLVLIYRSWLGDRWEVPFIGKLAARFVK